MIRRLCGSEHLSLDINLGTKCDWTDSHPIRFLYGTQGEEYRWATGLVWTWLLCNIFALCVMLYHVLSINVCMNTLNLFCLIKQIHIHAIVSLSVSFNTVYGIYKHNSLHITTFLPTYLTLYTIAVVILGSGITQKTTKLLWVQTWYDTNWRQFYFNKYSHRTLAALHYHFSKFDFQSPLRIGDNMAPCEAAWFTCEHRWVSAGARAH
jgi:hypothetical protein